MGRKVTTNTVLDRVVKIQGTQYDRKRHLTDKQVAKAAELYKQGLKIAWIARIFRVSPICIKYNIDTGTFKQEHLRRCKGKHTGVDNVDYKNRLEYKKGLVQSGKITLSKGE